jgi:hypothetical protein
MASPQDERLKVYEQLCNSYRAIDDFRAKLLGFLPLATGTGIFLLLGNSNFKDVENLPAATQCFLLAVGPFGFLITLGLFFYEIYGIKKCAALIKAGQSMEDLLDVNVGQFKKRPQNVAYLINEPFAAGVIYPTVLAAWTYFTLIFAWPKANPWIPISVLIIGFAWTLIYDFLLRRANKSSTGKQSGETRKE